VLEQETDFEPTEIMTDTGAYTDVIFGIFWLLGFTGSAAPPPWRAILEVSWRYWCASGCQSPGNNYLLRCALCLRAVSQPVRQSGLNPKVYKRAGASGGHDSWWLGRSHLLRNLP
jgi:Tn3 transposase DDE domain